MLFASHPFLLTFAASLICSVRGGVVTLYYVNGATTTSSPVPQSPFSMEDEGTMVASAIGSGDAGMTRYEIQQIWSKLVMYQPQTTITFISEPVTRTYTIAQGASAAIASAPLSIATSQSAGQVSYQGFKWNCTLDTSKNTGVCAEEDEFPRLYQTGSKLTTGVVTSTTTHFGTLMPIATVTTSDVNRNSRAMVAQAVLLIGTTIAVLIIL